MNRRRWLLVAGVAVVAVAGYLYFRSRSTTAQQALSPSGSSGATDQSASPLDTSGQGGGSATGTPTPSTDYSGLLSALSGENQSLLAAFLQSEQGLLSLAGSSPGSGVPSQSVSEPTATTDSASTTSDSIAGPGPAAAPAGLSPASSPAAVQAVEQAASTGSNAALANLAQYTAAQPAPQTFQQGVEEAQNTPIYVHANITPQSAPEQKPPPAEHPSGAGAVAAGHAAKNTQLIRAA